jgi:ATP-dependent RNA helicase DeaD
MAGTWRCLTRQPGQPWRETQPTGPAMPARWAAAPGKASSAPAHAIGTNGVAAPAVTRLHPQTNGHAAAASPGLPKLVRVAEQPVPAGAMPAGFQFGGIALSHPVQRAIWEAGYRQPMPIQALCIPHLLEGKDCVGQAQTGTGKTAAFGVPIVEQIDTSLAAVQAVILVPTRELCRQVTAELRRLGAHRGVEVLAVYGGEGMDQQLRALASGVHVVVGTPGRVQDHIWRGTLRLDRVRVAVLDEADEMLDVGFAEDIERILGCMPTERQTLLFSATIPPFVHRLVRRYLKEPVWVTTVDAAQPAAARVPERIRQSFVHVADQDKLAAVEELVRAEPGYDRVLVFRRMKIGVDRLAAAMQRKGYTVRALHGDLPQGERNRVLEDFRAGRIRFLIATNVAARGLDIDDVSHVLNFDLPDTPEEYVHRIGRTGRAGKDGTAVSFVAEWDFEAFEAIKALFGNALQERRLALYGSN